MDDETFKLLRQELDEDLRALVSQHTEKDKVDRIVDIQSLRNTGKAARELASLDDMLRHF